MHSPNTEATRKRGRPPARQAEIDRIEAELAPIEETTLLDLLGRLMAGLPPRDARDLGPETISQRIGAYVGTLIRYSEPTLLEAYVVIMDGRSPDIDARYLPTPPEIARLCRRIDQPKHAAIVRLRDELKLFAQREPSSKRAETSGPEKPDGSAPPASDYHGVSDFAADLPATGD